MDNWKFDPQTGKPLVAAAARPTAALAAAAKPVPTESTDQKDGPAHQSRGSIDLPKLDKYFGIVDGLVTAFAGATGVPTTAPVLDANKQPTGETAARDIGEIAADVVAIAADKFAPGSGSGVKAVLDDLAAEVENHTQQLEGIVSKLSGIAPAGRS